MKEEHEDLAHQMAKAPRWHATGNTLYTVPEGTRPPFQADVDYHVFMGGADVVRFIVAAQVGWAQTMDRGRYRNQELLLVWKVLQAAKEPVAERFEDADGTSTLNVANVVRRVLEERKALAYDLAAERRRVTGLESQVQEIMGHLREITKQRDEARAELVKLTAERDDLKADVRYLEGDFT